jgi:mRNA interferase RelE/StbE
MEEYKYILIIFDKAMKALNSFSRDDRRRIGHAMDLLQRDFSGDVKKLKGYDDRYRLRVGDFRVMFMLVKNDIGVYEIVNRKDAYGN